MRRVVFPLYPFYQSFADDKKDATDAAVTRFTRKPGNERRILLIKSLYTVGREIPRIWDTSATE